MTSLFILGDDRRVVRVLSQLLPRETLEVHNRTCVPDGVEEVRRHNAAIVALVLRPPYLPDLAYLDELRRFNPRLPVLVVAEAEAPAATAIEAMKRGALDYVTHPLEAAHLRGLLNQVLAVPADPRPPAPCTAPRTAVEHFVGRSRRMQEVYKAIGRVAPHGTTVLLLGESGTGKELVARAIHESSPRRDKPFVALNCAALPETLLESELFGHEQGAFTGAERQRVGKFEQADGGTLLLDEIGEMLPTTQAKVLRVIQEQCFERVGGNATIRTNVRLIAATNQALDRQAAAGRFRHDLLYRIQVFTVRLPPLRERREDVPLLVRHFLELLGPSLNKPVPAVAPEALAALAAYAWPGNVRELRGVIEQALLHLPGDVLTPDGLPAAVRDGGAPPLPPPGSAPAEMMTRLAEQFLGQSPGDAYRRFLEFADRVLLSVALKNGRGSQVKASRQLGISRTTLRAKLEQLQMSGGDGAEEGPGPEESFADDEIPELVGSPA